tara:strand:+ start:988 stop:2274 length:1287 start_codon:yes stop_codon:yes gene_type:complete
VALFIASKIVRKNKNKNHYYKYLIPGLTFKTVGLILFCLIYTFYYQDGDTINYFLGARALGNVILQNPPQISFSMLFELYNEYNNYLNYNANTGYPPTYMYTQPNTFIICRYTAVFYILGLGRFLTTSFLVSCFCFVGVWQIYKLFNTLYPRSERAMAFLILYVPSLVFWGSGIMKDSFVLGSACWITYNFYMIFIIRKKLLLNTLFLVLNIYIISSAKGYLLISLLPGAILWINNQYLKNIKSSILKFFAIPIFILIFGGIGFLISNNLSSLLGVYGNVDTVVEQAQVIQGDLLREEQYGSNNYYIGEIDGSLSSLIKLAPEAIFTAMFRPMLNEIGSPTMVFSGIENTILLIYLITLILRTSPVALIRILGKEPFLLYCIIFAFVFSFGVGIASTNFGALVRYKIPLIPFFFPAIYLVKKLSKENY